MICRITFSDSRRVIFHLSMLSCGQGVLGEGFVLIRNPWAVMNLPKDAVSYYSDLLLHE